MIEPVQKDEVLLEDIREAPADGSLSLWWLGQSGFLAKQGERHLLFDPYLSDSLTKKYAATDKPHVRMTANPVSPGELAFINAVTSSHNHTDHLDAETLGPLLEANPAMALVIPEANRAFVADRLEIDPSRPIGLVDGEAKKIADFPFLGVPAAHETVERDEQGHPKFMGYVVRLGDWTVYHSGDTLLFEGMADLLRPLDIDVAILPINGRRPERRVAGNLDGEQAAQLANDIGAGLVIPCHYDMFTFNTEPPDAFVAACERLGQAYRVMHCGERLTLQR